LALPVVVCPNTGFTGTHARSRVAWIDVRKPLKGEEQGVRNTRKLMIINLKKFSHDKSSAIYVRIIAIYTLFLK
jgi:hypothetical protein